MKTHEFIQKSIGNKVYLTDNARVLAFDGDLRKIIFNKTELTLLKLTKNGMAYLVDDHGQHYSVPPRYVREVGN